MWLFEVKKVFSRRGNKVAFLILLAAIMVIFIQALGSILYVNSDGNVISGIAAAQNLRNDKKQWSGELSEEVLERVIAYNREINNSAENLSSDYRENNKAEAKKQGYQDIRDLLNITFSPIQAYDYFLIDSLSSDRVGELYEKRIANLEEWLDTDDKNREYSDAEKDFLLEKFRQLETPLYYTSADGWKTLLEYAPTIMLMVTIILGFFVSDIFTNEFQTKADAVFFSAKLGRSKGVSAKIRAGFTIITTLFWGAMLLYTVALLMAMGTDGAFCYIQTDPNGWHSFYNITYLQAYLLTLLGGYLGCLFLLTLAMLASAKSRSPIVGVIIPFVLPALSSVLSGFSALRPFLKLWPDQLFQFSETLYTYDLYTFGGKVIGAIPVIFALYLVLYCILLPVLYHEYRKTKMR